MRVLTWLLALTSVLAADLEISRPERTWEFLDSVGPRSAFFGRENGTLEAWVYPLKILKDLRLRFKVGARVIPAESIIRTPRRDAFEITHHGSRPVELDLAPAYAPPVQVSSPNPTSSELTETDWHPHFRITLQPGLNTVAIEHTAALGYTMPWQPPVLANTSANLKVISERWLPDALELRLTGLPGREYNIALTDGRRIPVRIAGEGHVYRETTIRIPLKP